MTAPRSAGATRARLALVAVVLWPFASGAGPQDPLYRWSDADGNVRYTTDRERIPVLHRRDALRVELARDPDAPIPDLGTAPAEEKPPSAGDEGLGTALPPVEAAGDPGEKVSQAPPPPSALDARIAALEREIEADEDALTAHISDPERASALDTSEEITAIAERLPRLQDELRALRAQREAEAPSAGATRDADASATDAP